MPLMLKKSLRILLTLAVVAAAGVLVAALWNAYVLAPWTGTGASAHSVRIAPEVSGAVARSRWTTTSACAVATCCIASIPGASNWRWSRRVRIWSSPRKRCASAPRRRGAEQGSTTSCPRRTSGARGAPWPSPRPSCAARGRRWRPPSWTWSAACCARRSTVTSPIAPAPGDYAVAGKPDVTILDGGSFWITGYFEETKLRRIQPGAPRIRLMGFESPLTGRVASIGRGIADETTAWAITACRRSIRVSAGCGWRSDSRAHRDRAGARGVLLAAGMTCSVDVGEPGSRAWRAPAGGLAARDDVDGR